MSFCCTAGVFGICRCGGLNQSEDGDAWAEIRREPGGGRVLPRGQVRRWAVRLKGVEPILELQLHHTMWYFFKIFDRTRAVYSYWIWILSSWVSCWTSLYISDKFRAEQLVGWCVLLGQLRWIQLLFILALFAQINRCQCGAVLRWKDMRGHMAPSLKYAAADEVWNICMLDCAFYLKFVHS